MILLLAALLGLTPAELRGRELFTRGTSASGREISVGIGGGNVTAAMPCASCHGSDGTGRTEGGVTTPDIRWETLMRKYDERGVVRAVTMGTGLSPVMPRYHLWREDAQDLLAYLKRLGTLRDPGITDDAIVIGVSVSSDAMRGALAQWAADVNARGGIYARRIVLGGEPFVVVGDGRAVPEDVPLVAIQAADEPGPLVFSVSAPPSEERRVLQAHAQPGVSLVASASADEALASAASDLLLAARVLPSDVDPALLARLQAGRLVEQLNILAAARVVEETLRRAGRAVTRESFVTTLESTRELATGYGPPLTFDRARHHGTTVVRLLRFDLETKTLVPVD